MSEWDGRVPLLGFDGEYHREKSAGTVLIVPYGSGKEYIEVYAWARTHQHGEGYNVFFYESKVQSRAIRTPLDVKFVVQDFLNTLKGTTDGDEVHTSSA